jgi:hypothetical protein
MKIHDIVKAHTIVENDVSNYWDGSLFEKVANLGADKRGEWGEDLLADILVEGGFTVSGTGNDNTNNHDGVYDMKANGERTEVKTSIASDNWQHENIYSENKWDKIVFVDVDYDTIYFTVLDYDEMVFDNKHPILGRKPTLRQAREDAYKFDFGPATLRKGIAGGLTFRYDTNNPNDKGLIAFLGDRWSFGRRS